MKKLLPKIEEISNGKAHTNTRKLIWNILMVTDVFLNQIVKIFQISLHVFVCAFPLEISSIFGKSFSISFPFCDILIKIRLPDW